MVTGNSWMDDEQNLHRCHRFYGESVESSDLRVKIHGAVSAIAVDVFVFSGHRETPEHRLNFPGLAAKHCSDQWHVRFMPSTEVVDRTVMCSTSLQISTLKFHPQGIGIERWGPLRRPQTDPISFSHERDPQERYFNTAGEKKPAFSRQTALTCSLWKYIGYSV